MGLGRVSTPFLLIFCLLRIHFWALGLARPVDTRDPDTAPTPSRTPTALYAEEGGRCKAMEKNTKRWAYALVLEPPRTSQSVTSTLLGRELMAHTSDLPLTSQGTAGISGPK